jgi:hypothetical protein
MPDPFGRMKRNLTAELMEGATDGALKKAAPNWSNRVADDTDSARTLLSHVWGGFDWDAVDHPPSRYVAGYVRGA